MAFWDFLRAPKETARVTPPRVAARATTAGRLTTDSDTSFWGIPRVILPPPDAEGRWRLEELDTYTLDRISPADTLQLLSDLSPDISRALWDFLRFCNPGWKLTTLRPGTDDPDTRAQAVLDEFMATLNGLYGAVDVVIARLNIGAFLRGAFMAELVLDEAGRVPVDLATPDPATARFARADDPDRGSIWQLGQWQQRSGFVALDSPTVRYIPIDPPPGSPYGRSPASPALFPTLFLLGMMHDLRRVVQQQGYPRLDISILTDKIKELMPDGIGSDPAEAKTWIDAIITEVQNAYRALQPDDAFIHLDLAQMNRPVGTVNADSLGAIDGLIKALERMGARALKTMPFLLGMSESTTETQANRQYEAFVAGIRSFQHLGEQLLEHLLGVALQAQGIQATVQFRFAELRASEEMRDQQTLTLKIRNYAALRDQGWIDQDAAAMEVVGHEAVADPPAPVAPVGLGGPEAENPDPSTKRQRSRGHRQRFVPLGAGAPLPVMPNTVEFTEAERNELLTRWDEIVSERHRGLLDATMVNEES